jgi:hypothetical protein
VNGLKHVDVTTKEDCVAVSMFATMDFVLDSVTTLVGLSGDPRGLSQPQSRRDGVEQ